jgi:hypothetical protein
MDLSSASSWSQICVCGRQFSVPQAYTCHKRSCQKTKKRLSTVLEKAKDVWQAGKRRKMEEKTPSQVGHNLSNKSTAAEPASDDALAPVTEPEVVADPEVKPT